MTKYYKEKHLKLINTFENIDNSIGLTIKEKQVIEYLVDAYNEFVDLPNHHPNDTEEFTRYIHILQRQVMARVARRLHPEMFLGN